MTSDILFILLLFLLNGCNNSTPSSNLNMSPSQLVENITQQKESNSLIDRIETPNEFKRVVTDPNSFAHYLQHIPLKATGTPVKFHNGLEKEDHGIHAAVIDLPIGKEDLHQCADAVIRLKAEHLWQTKQYERIHFNFTNGHKVEYTEWMKGKRMIVNGNKTHWSPAAEASNNYEDFWEYLELIFMYAGTASLSKELKSIPIDQMQIGDVLILGGHPGHAVMIMDMAKNASTGQHAFLLAQSYMPAQEMHILNNWNDAALSPWYTLNDTKVISTPNWVFGHEHLKRFRN